MNDNNTNNVVEEGIASTIIKTGAKVIGKALAKSAPKAAKLAKNPAVKKAGAVVAKKAIRTKAFRSFVKALSKSKVINLVKNKRLVKQALKVGDKALFADTILDVYDMVKDYTSGKYNDVSWETIASAARICYLCNFS